MFLPKRFMRVSLGSIALIVALTAAGCSSGSGSGSGSSPTDPSTAPSATTAGAATSPTTAASTSGTTATTPESTAATTVNPAALETLPADNAVDPNTTEVVAPGDIPDNQVFVPYSPGSGTYTIRVPEGWARSEKADAVSFRDHFNSIFVRYAATGAEPSVESIRTSGLADVASDPTYRPGAVTKVTTGSGPAVLATFEVGSTANPVTGKKALLAVERYVYFRNGKQVTVTLAGAKGADNVDPWRIVSDSVRFP